MAKFIHKLINSFDMTVLFTDISKAPRKHRTQTRTYKYNSDLDAMRSDWVRIGKDLNHVIKKQSR